MKFHAVPETEVFVNENGHLVIKQRDIDLVEQFVHLPRSVATRIAESILNGDFDLADLEETEEQ